MKDHFVNLARLPEDLTFPPEDSDRIDYDGNTKRLIYRGPMCRQAYERLRQAHENIQYQQAIDDLFRVATFEVADDNQHKSPVMTYVCLGFIGITVAAIAIWWLIHS